MPRSSRPKRCIAGTNRKKTDFLRLEERIERATHLRKALRSEIRALEKDTERSGLLSELPGIIKEEKEMEMRGVFSLSFVNSSNSISCLPFSSKLDAYLSLQRSKSGEVLFYSPQQYYFTLTAFSEFPEPAEKAIWASESIKSWPIFTLPASILAERLNIDSKTSCSACEASGNAAKHIYGGKCKRTIKTF